MNNCVTIFILGRPGSGKSTAAQLMNHSFAQRGWSTSHIYDHGILQRMFLEDTDHIRFRPTENNGFDVIDFSVLDIALHEVECQAHACQQTAHFLTVEFARDDYRQSLQQFSPDFVRNAYVLFLDVDLETCLQRVRKRVKNPVSKYDHPAPSEDILRYYYSSDNRLYMECGLRQDFQLTKNLKVITNTGPLEVYRQQVKRFAQLILKRETFFVTTQALRTPKRRVKDNHEKRQQERTTWYDPASAW
jgi:thymidylate kinase